MFQDDIFPRDAATSLQAGIKKAIASQERCT